MAATCASSVKVHRSTKSFVTLLTSAACEWFLIFLLFLDAGLCYFLAKFASYCKLPTPCLLCSRLDHILGDEMIDSYRTLLCDNHKSAISSLIYCQIHAKLVDGHGMCEDCLLSFATKNKEISESQRLLGAKLGFDLNSFIYKNPFMNKDSVYGSSGTRPCSCCDKQWSSKQHAQRWFQLNSTASSAPTKPNIPLPRLPRGTRLNHRDSFKRTRAKFYGSVTSQRIGSSGVDPLSQVGYSELKITSDSESEVPFSDDDDSSIVAVLIQRDSKVVPESDCGDLVSVQESDHHSNSSGTLVIEPLVQCHDNEFHDVKRLSSAVSIGHGLSELNWEQAHQEFNHPALIELMTFDDIPSSVNAIEASDGSPSKNYFTGHDRAEAPVHPESSITTNGSESEPDQGSHQLDTSKADNADPCISSRSVVNGTEQESSNYSAEQFAQEADLSPHSTTPRTQVHHHDEPHITDGFSSESLDGNMLTDIDGESIVDRLKRQVEHDHKCLSSLYKELEEERNASAIAANQAMAMITRLQEEKAALHMEALQYLRMMEEQAEYDVDALQKANDLLAEKEKELQDYEADLEMYRSQYAEDSVGENFPETSCIIVKSLTSDPFKEDDKPPRDTIKTSWLEFEDEKAYISECLKKLEIKLHGVLGNGAAPTEMPNGECHGNEANTEDEQRDQMDHSSEENGVSTSKDFTGFNGSPLSQGGIGSVISDGEKSSIHFREKINLGVLENEVLDLNYRLEALEANRDFLEHALNTLQNGKEGLQFIQEITHQLEELRKIGLKQRSQFVP